MSVASPIAAAEFDADQAVVNPAAIKRPGTINKIQDDVIREVLHSMAELRRYILVSHPALLKETSPALVQAESQIFSIMGQLGG